jgi:hypothetical protein
MKYLFLIIFCSTAFATDWCDIQDAKTGQVLSTYEGQCDQHNFGGPWGDPTLTKHVVNTTKDASDAAKAQAEQSAQALKAAREARIKSACAAQTNQFLKDVCDELAGD